MIEAFNTAIDTIKSPYVEDWIKSGKKVVGYTCSFIPGEVFHAGELLPYRLRGHGVESQDIADAYFGPFVCSFPKCLLQLIGEGKYKFLDGVVISTSCDSVRRLSDTWRAAAKDIPDILPDFFHYMGVPFKVAPHAVEWYTAELRKLIDHFNEHFDAAITDEKLKKSIQAYNTSRDLLAEIDTFRIGDKVMITGTEMYNVVLAGNVMPRDEYNKNLKDLLATLKKKEKPADLDGSKRIMVCGSICDDADMISVIEEAGAVVVAESVCFGIRGVADNVSLEGDPVKALVIRYMEESICPRFIMSFDKRMKYVQKKAAQANVQGAIFQNIRFCEFHGSENSVLERAFEDLDIPSVCLEREHGPLNEKGRMRLRIDALLNRI